jgi:flagellar biosynthetic protein FlhB
MAENDFGDKTEAPTPRRRLEAREQGQVARSPDLTTAVLLLAIIFMLDWYGPGLVTAMKTLMGHMLGADSLRDATSASAIGGMWLAVRLVAAAMAPLLIGIVIVAVIVNILQVGFFFSFKRIHPKLSGLNPFKGLGRIFSRREGFVHFIMNLLKLVLIGVVAYTAIHDRMAIILSTQQLSFIQIFGLGTEVVYSIALRIGIVLLILAILDYAWQRWNTEQRLKMTKQEVKDEMKRMEGDPKIKSRRRQLAMQRLVQGARANVPTADVVVTNPTEFAVALRYDPEAMHAPKVVAKGTDYLAMTIRQIAIEHGVPILERPPLARALYRLCDIGQEIPEQFYSAVAEILAYVYELSGKARRQPQPLPA